MPSLGRSHSQFRRGPGARSTDTENVNADCMGARRRTAHIAGQARAPMGAITTPSSYSPDAGLYKYGIYIPAGDTVSFVVDQRELKRFPTEHSGYVDRWLHVRRVSFSSVPQLPCVYTSRGRPYYKYSILLHAGDILYVNPDNGKDNPWAVKVEWRDKYSGNYRLSLNDYLTGSDFEGLPCPPFFFQNMRDAYVWLWE